MTERRPMGERVTVVETSLSDHIKSCDRKATWTLALLVIVLGASLTGTGVLLRAALHLGG